MTPRQPRARLTLFALICVLVALPALGASRVPLPAVLSLRLPRAPDLVFGDANREVLITCTALFKVSLIKSVKATGWRDSGPKNSDLTNLRNTMLSIRCNQIRCRSRTEGKRLPEVIQDSPVPPKVNFGSSA